MVTRATVSSVEEAFKKTESPAPRTQERGSHGAIQARITTASDLPHTPSGRV